MVNFAGRPVNDIAHQNDPLQDQQRHFDFMSFWLLIRRSLVYHARSHLGVILGAAIGTAALTGALLVGDSVRGSLRDHALERLQGVSYALSSGDRFFRQDLAERLDLTSVSLTNAGGRGLVQTPGFARAAAFQVSGTVSRQDGGARATRVTILGVDLVSWCFVSRDTSQVIRLWPSRSSRTRWTSFLLSSG